MPIRTRRKAAKVGGAHGSLYVNLPKDWTDGMQVVQGTPLDLVGEDILVVCPPGTRRTAEILLDLLRDLRGGDR